MARATKRLISVLLAVTVLLLCTPIIANAEENDEMYDYYSLEWTINGDTLTISGKGKMPDYDMMTCEPPWSDKKESIKKLVIKDGITGIGENAFSGCVNLTDITIPNSVTSIG